MTTEVIALGLTLLVHVIGAGILIAVIARNSGADLFGWWPRDDDGRGPEPDPQPVAPEPRDGLPLSDARPAPVRVRHGERLGDVYGRPARRPVHPPQPAREPQREREPQP